MRHAIFAALFTLAAGLLFADDISGRVVSADGKPLAAAHIYVYQALPRTGPNTLCPSCYRDCGKHEALGADGAFTIRDLDPKLRFQLLAVASGYEPQFSDYTPGGTPVTLTLKPRAATDLQHLVCGNVIDPNGKPVVGAVVEPAGVHTPRGVGYGAIPGVDRLSITDANGEFALRVRDDATALDVRIRARNFAPIIHRMLKPGEARTVQVTPGAAVSGRVIAADGKPLGGAIVKIDQLFTWSMIYLGTDRIATDENGRFLLAPLGPNEIYRLSLITDSTVPRTLATKLVEVGGDMTSADAGTIQLTSMSH